MQGTSSAVTSPDVIYNRPPGGDDRHSLQCRHDTCCIWSHIVPDMARAFSADNGTRCSSLARNAIRMGFHDAAAWNTSIPVSQLAIARNLGSGGADGSILLSEGEIDRPENNGFRNYGNLVLSWHNDFNDYARKYDQGAGDVVSVADLIQMAAVVATVTCPGGPRIRAFVGRPDVAADTPPPPRGLIPPPTYNATTIIDMFAAKTLSSADLVALLGAHTVSQQFFADRMYAGQPQDTTHGVFDTRYYAETGAQKAPAGIYRFHSDLSVAAHPATQPLWKQFSRAGVDGDADTHQQWTDAFAQAYFRLSLLGVHSLNGMTDCSGVVPQTIDIFG